MLIDRVVSCLKDEFVQRGSHDDFEKLKVFLLGQAEIPYSELARDMCATEGSLKVVIHRLRKRYRILFLETDRGDRRRPSGGRFRNSLSACRAPAKRLTCGMQRARLHLSISDCSRLLRAFEQGAQTKWDRFA